MIAIENISKKYSGHYAIKNINFKEKIDLLKIYLNIKSGYGIPTF